MVQPAASAGPALRVIMAERKVPGRDRAHHAHGFAQDQDAAIGEVLGNGLAVDSLALFGKPLDEACGIGDLATRLGQRLALLEGHELRQVLLVSSISSNQRRSTDARSFAVFAFQAGNATAAASMALRVSPCPCGEWFRVPRRWPDS